MPIQTANPRILIITPEVTYLPGRMGSFSNYLTAKAGGLADVSAGLINALFDQGADVHVALPNYRAIFSDRLAPRLSENLRRIRRKMPEDRIHLAEDRAFFYLNRVYAESGGENTKLALAFQREVINNIVPLVNPDLIHCNDWMTGLIPSMSRVAEVPCLFTIHNIHTVKSTLAHIEDRGIDAAYFWHHLYFEHYAQDYEQTREANPVDFLVSGVFGAHFVNTVSPTFLMEIVEGRHHFVDKPLRQELINKWQAECAFGILNAPDPSFNPQKDPHLWQPYGPETHAQAKRINKTTLQKKLGLIVDEKAPLLFWPSRLDDTQKGCQLLADILYTVVSRHWDLNLQIVFVANGDFQHHFRNIVAQHNFHRRVAICDFDVQLEHRAYGAADFLLMPSRFEPCGLPQMIGPIYGVLPIAHDTGGIHDTVTHLMVDHDEGNGFLFETFDAGGLYWAIEQAVKFFKLPHERKTRQIERIMHQGTATFNHDVTARQYIDLYEKMLQRPLINRPMY